MPAIGARYHFAINVPRGSILDAAAWIAKRHELLAFRDDPDEEEGATIARTDRGASALYFLDAGGNVVELIANDHLDNESDAPFGPEAFLEVAELGATADTGATCAAIQDALSAEVLWGGREGWLLTAIGDDHGLVIVAPTGRGWIPVGYLHGPYRPQSWRPAHSSVTSPSSKGPIPSARQILRTAPRTAPSALSRHP